MMISKQVSTMCNVLAAVCVMVELTGSHPRPTCSSMGQLRGSSRSDQNMQDDTHEMTLSNIHSNTGGPDWQFEMPMPTSPTYAPEANPYRYDTSDLRLDDLPHYNKELNRFANPPISQGLRIIPNLKPVEQERGTDLSLNHKFLEPESAQEQRRNLTPETQPTESKRKAPEILGKRVEPDQDSPHTDSHNSSNQRKRDEKRAGKEKTVGSLQNVLYVLRTDPSKSQIHRARMGLGVLGPERADMLQDAIIDAWVKMYESVRDLDHLQTLDRDVQRDVVKYDNENSNRIRIAEAFNNAFDRILSDQLAQRPTLN